MYQNNICLYRTRRVSLRASLIIYFFDDDEIICGLGSKYLNMTCIRHTLHANMYILYINNINYMHKVKNIGFQGHHRPTHITWG